ncbi:MAG: TIGR01620 family protein [Mesorhizobium sp.]|nr:TIGR01620 family protein [Mesorhizobium sp.]MCO5163474.1 TIGR01620 family protein [Mesorhizobium sp.]
MTQPRQPASFRLTPEPQAAGPEPEPVRKPRAVRKEEAVLVVPAEIDVFEQDGLDALAPPAPLKPRPPSRLGALFFGALGTLLSLAAALWAERLIRDLFGRSEWLGWLGIALAGTVLVTFLAILVRELYALARLVSVEALRARAEQASRADDSKSARAAVADLVVLVGKKPETAAGRRAVVDLKGEIIDGADFLRYAEAEILAPLDEKAKDLILDAAKRVSIVTAVSPRALVDLGYVLWEAGRLVRRMSELYGGRPGTLGFFRLTRSVLAHLAVTGSIAAGDSVIQQLVGHGLAARISAKLGEGVVNGMMTVRIGIAAMEAARPFPFDAVKRPGMGDFASALATFTSRKREAGAGEEV